MSLALRFVRVLILAALILVPAASVFAAPDIIPVDEIKTGMKGIAKTVVTGTRIEEFDVEVLGVMKNKGPSGDLILIRASGDIIDRTGGIAQGMSGSPVYIQGRLAGAVAYGWPFTDHRVGMVTPIGDMLKLWNLEDKRADVNEPAEQSTLEPEVIPAATPLMAAGFSAGALDMLKTKLGPLNLVPYAVGAAPAEADFGPLEPGSAVGVELARGDASLGAVGTVTYVEDGRVLAFGHPFLKRGASRYFMSNSYIFTTVNGQENSFKVGVTGPLLGTINQDRGAGIAGSIGLTPPSIPLDISVLDFSTGNSRDAKIEVIKDEQLSPILAAASVFSIIEKTTDRVGAGTAKVSFELSARNMPGEVFKRENMFYSPTNINELAVAEIHELLTLLGSNQFQAVDVLDLKVNVAVEPERRTAIITQARASAGSAKPGDKIDVIVDLKPYRGEAITRTVNFTIPKDQAPGPLTLEVRGGGTVPLVELLKRQISEGEIMKLIGKLKNQTFADMIKELAERDKNNDIVVEVLDTNLGEGLGGLAKSPAAAGKKIDAGEGEQNDSAKAALSGKKDGAQKDAAEEKEKVKSSLSTEYIIDSDTQVVVNIIGDGGSQAKAKLGARGKTLDDWR